MGWGVAAIGDLCAFDVDPVEGATFLLAARVDSGFEPFETSRLVRFDEANGIVPTTLVGASSVVGRYPNDLWAVDCRSPTDAFDASAAARWTPNGWSRWVAPEYDSVGEPLAIFRSSDATLVAATGMTRADADGRARGCLFFTSASGAPETPSPVCTQTTYSDPFDGGTQIPGDKTCRLRVDGARSNPSGEIEIEGSFCALGPRAVWRASRWQSLPGRFPGGDLVDGAGTARSARAILDLDASTSVAARVLYASGKAVLQVSRCTDATCTDEAEVVLQTREPTEIGLARSTDANSYWVMAGRRLYRWDPTRRSLVAEDVEGPVTSIAPAVLAGDDHHHHPDRRPDGTLGMGVLKWVVAGGALLDWSDPHRAVSVLPPVPSWTEPPRATASFEARKVVVSDDDVWVVVGYDAGGCARGEALLHRREGSATLFCDGDKLDVVPPAEPVHETQLLEWTDVHGKRSTNVNDLPRSLRSSVRIVPRLGRGFTNQPVAEVHDAVTVRAAAALLPDHRVFQNPLCVAPDNLAAPDAGAAK